MRKRLIEIIFVIVILIAIVYFIQSQINVQASTKKDGIENFPESYKPYLYELQNKYPNWKFTALYTNLDWNYVIQNENIFGKNLVPKGYSDAWKNTNPGEYNVEVDLGWVDCSKRALEYCMDPRNFLNDVRLFQFERLSYDESTNSKEGIEKILYGTEFYNRIVEYKEANGNNIVTQYTYSDLIKKAGGESKVSSYHLASRIKQEVGPFLSHSSISGIVPGYEGLYNFYNIGATSSAEPMGAIKNGLRYARDGKGASQQTQQKYLIPWVTKEKAITGGGIFIGSSYINIGQNTIYLQKFDVNDDKPGSLFWHQYMTNVLAPYSEGKIIWQGYSKMGMLNTPMSFIIPVYENMPQIPVDNPNIKDSDFIDVNEKVRANVSGRLNIRTGPSTSYEIITAVDSNQILTRIKKGKQAGELWDKVILQNGIIGYAFQNYLVEVPEQKPQIKEIQLSLDSTILQKTQTATLKVNIIPEEAKNEPIVFMSSNPNIVQVDQNGNLLAIRSGTATITVRTQDSLVQSQIEVTVYSKVTDIGIEKEILYLPVGGQYTLNPILYPEDASTKEVEYNSQNEEIAIVNSQGTIQAIKQGETKIEIIAKNEDVKKEISVFVTRDLLDSEIQFAPELTVNGDEITGLRVPNYTVEELKNKIQTIFSIEVVDSENQILQDDKLVGTNTKVIVKEGDVILREYTVILYGDVNGDGKINSVDLLVLQRHILEIEKLKGAYLRAGNINKNGKNPSSLDCLLIQRHILKLGQIQQ